MIRKCRKQPVSQLNPWNSNAEPGDRVFEMDFTGDYAVFYDLRERRGRNKRASGDLTPVLVKKDGQARRAVFDGDTWYWID